MCQFRLHRIGLAALIILFLQSHVANATWSVVIANRDTGEVAASQATCLSNRDLLRGLAAVRVGVGFGVVQNSGDPDGTRRQTIVDGFINSLSPQEILTNLSGIRGHNTRQYGICNTTDLPVSFSGNGGRNWNGGIVGVAGLNDQIVYAIQGNTLVGPCVVDLAEDEVLAEISAAKTAMRPVDIPGALMAAMEKAREVGGDGRCSCGGGSTSCGCPILQKPEKSAHVGYFVVARAGDPDDPVCDVNGCADEDYFMTFNVIDRSNADLDPIDDISGQFVTLRTQLANWVDAVQSQVSIDPTSFLMTINLKNWAGISSSPADAVVSVVNLDSGLDMDFSMGPLVQNNSDSSQYTLQLTAESQGTDKFEVTVTDKTGVMRNVVLMPSREATNAAPPSPPPPSGCVLKKGACTSNGECCSGKCQKGKCVGGPSTAGFLFEVDETELMLLAENNMSPAACSVPMQTLQY